MSATTTVPHTTARILGSLAMTEVGAGGVAMGAMRLADKLAPDLMEAVSQKVSKSIVSPHLKAFEKVAMSAGHSDPRLRNPNATHEEKSDAIANQMVRLGIGMTASTLSSFPVESVTDHFMGIHPDARTKWKGIGAEIVTQVGACIVLNTMFCKPTQAMVKGVKNTLCNLGVSEKGADDFANYLVRWEIPNGIGLIARLATLHHGMRP